VPHEYEIYHHGLPSALIIQLIIGPHNAGPTTASTTYTHTTACDIHYIHRQQSATVMRLTPSGNVSHHWAAYHSYNTSQLSEIIGLACVIALGLYQIGG